MKKVLSLSLLCVSLFALDPTDRQAIDQMVGHFTSSWNEGAGRGCGEFYAQDADFVNIFGTAFAGKEEIEARHVKILETFLKGSKFEVLETKVREASPTVAIAHVYWKVTHVPKPGAETMKGVFTHTLVKNKDHWEIAATQNTLISP